ncbi:MAG: Ig-like domain-containing protein [Bacteroidetes bacterium]|nr:Ig-like domain-containing protein [Bacteroidota bacterium]
MKRILLFVLMSFLGLNLFAQVLMQQDFSAGQMPPTGWMVFGNTANWTINQANMAGGIVPEGMVKSTPAFNGTMRLISSGVNTTGLTQVIIQFKHMFDHTDGNSTAFTIAVDTRSNGGTWHNVWTKAATGDISAETVTIGVNNTDVGSSNFQFCLYVTGSSTNFKAWYFDDITVLNPLTLDAGMAAVTIPSSFVGSHILEGKFVNVGLTAINAVNVNWQANEGDIHTTNFTGLNLTTGSSYSFTCSDSVALVPGVYNLKVWVSGVNGLATPDDNPVNDTMVKNIAIPEHMAMRRPMFEEFTSSTCAPCASFNASTFNPFIAQHGDEITLVKYQMNWPGAGDPYYTAEGGVRRAYYGVNAVPDLYTDGKVTATNTSAVNNAFNTSLNTITYMDIQSQHEIQGNNVIINANILPYANYSNVTVYVVVVEHITTGNVATNGETEFHNVMMKMVPDANGTAVNLTANQPLNLQFTQDMSATNVEQMSDLLVAIFVQDNSTKEIYQSNYSQETGSMFTMTPANGATGVLVNAPMSIQFSQPIRMVGGQAITNSNVADLITLKENGPAGANAGFTATINSSKTLITVTPNPNLKYGQLYYLKVDTAENLSGVHTMAGVSMFTTETSTVGLPKVDQVQCKVVPNPANELLTVQLSDNNIVNRIELLNSLGSIVRNIDNVVAGERNIQLYVGNLPSGIYYVRLLGNSSPQTLRVVISR